MNKTISLLLFGALCAAAGASPASVHIDCKVEHGKCVPPPAPPAPPTPPAPPAPPPLPPMPTLPDVPQAAHNACATKAPGSALTWVLKKGETMTGTCERENGKMVFQMRSYQLED